MMVSDDYFLSLELALKALETKCVRCGISRLCHAKHVPSTLCFICWANRDGVRFNSLGELDFFRTAEERHGGNNDN